MKDPAIILETERLYLRRWRESDGELFADLNADPDVMEHFPSVHKREESLAAVPRIDRRIEENGFGLFAVEVKDGAPFIGFVGLQVPRFEAHFMPAVELGWRIAKEHWNQGYATEGALACVEFASGKLGLEPLISFTVPQNLASRRVMEKLGMTHDPNDDFDHPSLPEGHRLRRHVLYRL